MLPVGLAPPDRWKVSVAECPKVIVAGETVVEKVGPTGFTVMVSRLSPQAPEAALLKESPLYAATQRYVPVFEGVNPPDV